jgi:cell division protein FtsI (penicillin-binding protein 3)
MGMAVFFTLFLTLIAAKAAYLQIFQGAWLARKAADQYEKSLVIEGRRGAIVDARHREMAVSIDVTSIGAYPRQLADKPAAAKALAHALNLNYRLLLRKLESKSPFVWIKRQVTPKEAGAVRALSLPGVDFVPERSRFYPSKTLAAQALGFTGTDGHGLEGVEFFFDKEMRGAAENYTLLRDARGKSFSDVSQWIDSHGGRNVVLTIDRTVQYLTERALQEAVDEFEGRSGMAIVMVPQTGAILALAHYPFFNPNVFRAFEREKWRNRAITDPFEPGSSMKMFLAAAALESGRLTPNSIFFCENGKYRIGGNVVHDTHPHGWLSMQQIIKVSSNIGAVKIIETLGQKSLHSTLRNFGFGAPTGIDCPGETAGSLSPYQRWTRIDAGAISFGQGLSVSALQLITAASAIANDGVLMKPFLVQAVTDRDGRLVKSFHPTEVRRAISAQTALRVRNILQTVTSKGGTGENAALEGFEVAGKTGTAQKVDEGGRYAQGRYVSSFLGFAPAKDPKVAILVLVDEPRKAHYGGTVAAPAFRKIAHGTLNYLNVTPRSDTARQTALRGAEAEG